MRSRVILSTSDRGTERNAETVLASTNRSTGNECVPGISEGLGRFVLRLSVMSSLFTAVVRPVVIVMPKFANLGSSGVSLACLFVTIGSPRLAVDLPPLFVFLPPIFLRARRVTKLLIQVLRNKVWVGTLHSSADSQFSFWG